MVFAKGVVPVDTLDENQSKAMLINSENVETIGEDAILDFLNQDEPGYEDSKKKGKASDDGLGDMAIE